MQWEYGKGPGRGGTGVPRGGLSLGSGQQKPGDSQASCIPHYAFAVTQFLFVLVFSSSSFCGSRARSFGEDVTVRLVRIVSGEQSTGLRPPDSPPARPDIKGDSYPWAERCPGRHRVVSRWGLVDGVVSSRGNVIARVKARVESVARCRPMAASLHLYLCRGPSSVASSLKIQPLSL